MTLQEALAIYLYLQGANTIGKREEQIIDAAWKIIEREAKKAIESIPGKSSDQ